MRISSDPKPYQQDQPLARQIAARSPQIRNQTFNVDSRSGGPDESLQNIAPFKTLIKSPFGFTHALNSPDELADKSEDKD
jgi:hypothetical protein